MSMRSHVQSFLFSKKKTFELASVLFSALVKYAKNG